MRESLIEKYTPEVWSAFLKQIEETMRDGVLSTKINSLLGLNQPLER